MSFRVPVISCSCHFVFLDFFFRATYHPAVTNLFCSTGTGSNQRECTFLEVTSCKIARWYLPDSACSVSRLQAVGFASAQEKAAPSTAQVHVVITDMALRSDSEVPRLKPEEVKVKQGKTFLQVTQLIPAQGDNAALQLMILIDDTLNTHAVGNNLNDVKEFIKAQPPSTVVAVGYMSNATVNMLQNFTADHEQAIKAIRLPRGGVSTMDSPYLSLISVVKGWPQQTCVAKS